VPACYATGDFAHQAYAVIEPIPGTTLYSRLGELPLPYEEARVIAWKIAVALADLHRQNVIHHDIKPSSVMFRPTGEAVLIDYGLSHHNQLPDLLQEEFRVPYGTAPYMAPERLLGVRDDPRSDLFSLGVLLYFFTTGVRPFGETETMRGMRRRLWRDPHPPRKLKADYPPWLQEVVLRCLEIEPVWRYPTASRPDQADGARRAAAARPALHRLAPPLQRQPDGAARQGGRCRATGCGADRRDRARYDGGLAGVERGAAGDHPTNPRDAAVGEARLPECAEARPRHHRPDARRSRQQQAYRPASRVAALGVAIEAG
jgi:serine/threonine protein kinase